MLTEDKDKDQIIAELHYEVAELKGKLSKAKGNGQLQIYKRDF